MRKEGELWKLLIWNVEMNQAPNDPPDVATSPDRATTL